MRLCPSFVLSRLQSTVVRADFCKSEYWNHLAKAMYSMAIQRDVVALHGACSDHRCPCIRMTTAGRDLQDLDGGKWVPRSQVMEVIKQAGLRDKGLADHLLKHLANVIADGHVLFR